MKLLHQKPRRVSKAKRSLLNQAFTKTSTSAVDSDSDIEVIETNVTVIDLDDTSNDHTVIDANVHSLPPSVQQPLQPPPQPPSTPQTPKSYAQVLATPPPQAAQSTSGQQLLTVAAAASSALVIDDSPVDAAEENHSLFFNDSLGAHGECSYRVPLYDPISDDSFCSEVALTPLAVKATAAQQYGPALPPPKPPAMTFIDLDDVSFDELNQTIVVDATVAATTAKTSATPTKTKKADAMCTFMPTPIRPKRKSNLDNSVIFVSETLYSPTSSKSAESYIPLPILVSAFEFIDIHCYLKFVTRRSHHSKNNSIKKRGN